MRRNQIALGVLVAFAVGCGSDSTAPTTPPDNLVLTPGILKSLDSSAVVIKQANPGNADLEALVDSTLLVLSAGVQAKRMDVTTDLTTAPLYFVAVHRAFGQSGGGSFSTWTLVGFDDPTHLTTLIEVGGYAASSTGSAPSAVTGTIGDGGGIVNALFLRVAVDASVTEWNARSGSASFASDAAGATCPGFTATAHVTCVFETTHVHFSASAPSGTGGATSRQAIVATDIGVPAIRLDFAP